VRFYEIRRKPDTFLLTRHMMELDEMMVILPRRSLSIYEGFRDLDQEVPGNRDSS